MSELSEHTRLMWETLKQAATDTLEHKRRLGQYAVIWQDGQPVIIGGESSEIAPSDQATAKPASSSKA